MTLTAWNDGPGGPDFRTRIFVLQDCDRPEVQPQKSYWVIGDQTRVDSTVQVDPLSDDRFQRVLRVALSTRPVIEVLGGCLRYEVYTNNLASVWNLNLMAVAGVPAVAGGLAPASVPEIQFRVIQSMRGNQTKRSTFLYKSTTAKGSLGYLLQLHGIESSELEILAWIDPEVNGTVSATMSLGVGCKMEPSSGNDVSLGNDCSAIP